MSAKKLGRTRRQGMTFEQACGAIRETVLEAAEIVQQHAQRTRKAINLLGRIMSTHEHVRGMTLEQAYGVMRETLPEAAKVMQERAQTTQRAIDRAGQIMPSPDKNAMSLEQARGTLRETLPESVEVLLEQARRVQKILGPVDGIMKYARAIKEGIKRRLAPGQKKPGRPEPLRMTFEQACGAIRETVPEAAEIVRQHAQGTQEAISFLGEIMSVHGNVRGMTLEQACGAVRKTLPEAAEVVQERAETTQRAIDRAGQIMSDPDKNGMTLKQAHDILRRIMPEAAEIMQQHAQSTQKAIHLTGQIMSACDNLNGECTRHFNDYGKLLKNDYREFARNDTYPEEAEAYANLGRIHSLMNQMRLAPQLASRNMCTVAGSFSSGKSSFLNSLIGDKILPIEITPSTSIPTFVTHVNDNELEIHAFNTGGGKTPIDTSTFQQMTHEFKDNYGIPLNQIVERIVINTSHLGRWNKVAFIDTPGYTNPGDAQKGGEDQKIALQEVLTNPFLIWVVDCERGTLPQQDIDCLCGFRDQRKLAQVSSYRKSIKPIFIVLNKADKKTSAERRKILQNVKKVVTENKIPCYGIGFFSSQDEKWYGRPSPSFDEFLEMMNRARTMIKLDKEIGHLFDDYVRFHEDERRKMKGIIGLIKRIDLRLDDDSSRLRRDVGQAHQDFDRKLTMHQEHAEQSRDLKDKFIKCTQGFMEAIKVSQNA